MSGPGRQPAYKDLRVNLRVVAVIVGIATSVVPLPVGAMQQPSDPDPALRRSLRWNREYGNWERACALWVAVWDDGSTPDPVRVWSAVTPAVPTLRVQPRQVSRLGEGVIAGVIFLNAWIDENGNVAGVKVVRSIQYYDSVAIEAVKQWKFSPARLDGRAIAVVQSVRVTVP